MDVLIGLVLLLGLIALAVLAVFLFVRGTYRFFRDLFKPDPMINEICDYGNWKFHNGFGGYKSPETERKLRRMYNEEKRNR
jgi:hypothetical protein